MQNKSTPKVFNIHHKGDEVSEYIGRGTKWGNPFHIGYDGDRRQVIQKFKDYLEAHPSLKEAALIELAGKNLLCYCAPLPCHGDYLLEIANPNLNNPLSILETK